MENLIEKYTSNFVIELLSIDQTCKALRQQALELR